MTGGPVPIEAAGVIIAFWVLAAVTLGAALMVAFVRDLVHAVLFLILSFVGVAGLYVTLSADFIAVVQVLIYAGAVSVLLLFGIMLTPRSARDNAPVPYTAPIAVVAGMLGAVILFVALKTDWPQADSFAVENTAREIGRALLDPFVLPFEVASVLLVVAMVGSIVLVRPSEEEP